MKRVCVLGSTGSIGTQALQVISASRGELVLCGLSAHSDAEQACRQASDHGVDQLALSDPAAAPRASEHHTGTLHEGPGGLLRLIAECKPDLVLNAIVGSAGLAPTIVALTEGIDVALANKESLVVGGELVMALAEGTGARLLPVDSEHSALAQLLDGRPPGTVRRLVVTASGGPFRGRDTLDDVTREQALAHPTWDMGGKISIDSATLMNKGLEVIEAHHLFGLGYDRIGVVVHPQSIVHALVDLVDGATLAHLGYPDMRVPIAGALHWPDRAPVDLETLDLASVGRLEFEEPDPGTFRCLALARDAGRAGGTAPCVLNAANEVAVHAFLDDRIAFAEIPAVVAGTLDAMGTEPVEHFEQLFEIDALARERADGLLADGAPAR